MLNFNTITPALKREFCQLLGEDSVFDDLEMRQKHSLDKSGKTAFLPEIVLKPRTTEGVAAVLRCCNAQKIAVTTQGGLSGLTGAALPIVGGVALSMERFDKILNIDTKNFQVTTETGVITAHLQHVLQSKNLFYPPDPQGRGSSFIGGNINTNAGGPKCVKYGVTRDYVLNLEIVLPNGELFWTGANTLKNATGYNLTQLLIGSEGTLAVVTKAVLKVLPYPPFSLLLLAPFRKAAEACAAVTAIFEAGIVPSGLEFLDNISIYYAAKYVEKQPFDEDFEAFLYIEVDGANMEILMQDCEKIAICLAQFDIGALLFADSEAQKSELWKIRRCVSLGLTTFFSARLSEDTAVPRAELPRQWEGIRQIARQYAVKIAVFGHLGDGNMHISILNDHEADDIWRPRATEAKRAIFELTHSMGGILSAEHGVGLWQKNFVPIFLNEVQLNLLRGIKKVFDPHCILNPHKIFDL